MKYWETFNCTTLELKLGLFTILKKTPSTFNCTTLELKLRYDNTSHTRG